MGRHPHRLLVAATLLLLVPAVLLVFGPGGDPSPGRRPAAFETRPFPGRILLIGIDGLDAELLERMGSAGSCPELTAMASSGRRYRMVPVDPGVPPAVWTSIATGRPPREHGVLGYQAGRLPGIRAGLQEPAQDDSLAISFRLLFPPMSASAMPVSSGFRRSPAVWEILADGGVETAAVNWWATWPAIGTGATVVSERAFPRLLAAASPDRDIAPAGLQQALADRFEADQEGVRRGLREAGIDPDAGTWAHAATIDGYHALVARRLVDSGLVRVMLLYLPGLDIVRSAGGDAVATVAMVRHLDSILGSLLSSSRPDDIVIVAGDPGRAERGGRAAGIVLIAGKRVEPHPGAGDISPLDLAPTVLALAGFPAALDMEGSAVLGFLSAGDPRARPIPAIPTYGDRAASPAPSEGDDFDEAVLERLRSLGYIQ